MESQVDENPAALRAAVFSLSSINLRGHSNVPHSRAGGADHCCIWHCCLVSSTCAVPCCTMFVCTLWCRTIPGLAVPCCAQRSTVPRHDMSCRPGPPVGLIYETCHGPAVRLVPAGPALASISPSDRRGGSSVPRHPQPPSLSRH